MVELRTLDRCSVIGTTGAGKTTFGAGLSRILRAPHVELDAIYWLPGWVGREEADFRARVGELAAGDLWVMDGNYRKVRDIVWGRATCVVWLNYSFALVFWRLLRRSIARIVPREELFSGNSETVKGMFFSRDSLLLWAVKSHRRHQRSYRELRESPQYAHLSWYELARPAQAQAFLAEVAAALKGTQGALMAAGGRDG